MWNLFKKRQEGDLRRLITAFRFYLKAAQQAQGRFSSGEEDQESRKWKGGFGKAFNQLFHDWPTPDQSRRFEKRMRKWLNKVQDTDRSFVLTFNDYLGQKRLNPQELDKVLHQGRQDFRED